MTMDDLTMWNLIVGFLLPNVVAVLQQPRWSKPLRTAVTAVVCILGGFGTAFFTGEFGAQNVVTSILIVGVATITFYKGFWKSAGVAPAIESATSSTKDEKGEASIFGLLVLVLAFLLILFLVGVL